MSISYRWSYILLLLCLPAFKVTGQEHEQISNDWIDKNYTPAYTLVDSATIMDILRRGKPLVYETPDSALVFFQEAYKLSYQKGFVYGALLALIRMAQVETGRGNYVRSLAYYKEAERTSKYLFHSHYLIATLYNDIGLTYFFQGNYERAMYNYTIALQQATGHKLPQGRNFVATYSNLGIVYLRLQQPEMALQYLERAEAISRNKNEQQDIAITLCNKGEAYSLLKKYDKALEALQEALTIAKENKYTEIEQAIYNGLGELMLKQGKPAEAIAYLQQTERGLSKAINPVYSTVFPGYNLGMAYYQLKNYDKAEKYLLKALAHAHAIGLIDDRIIAHKTLADIYETTGRYEQSLKQQKIYQELQDSLLSREKARDINDLEIKYRTSEKDKEIIQHQLRISEQGKSIAEKNIWITGIAFSALIVVVLLLLQRQKNRRLVSEREIERLKAIIEGEEKERMRLAHDLHDSVNSRLAATSSYLTVVKKEYPFLKDSGSFNHIGTMLAGTAAEVRQIAHNLLPQELTLKGLPAAVRDFCHSIFAQHSLDADVQVYGNFDDVPQALSLTLYRLVQEIMHNVIKHAAATAVVVLLSRNEKEIILTVEDNGQGIPEEVLKMHQEGIGLPGLYHRVKAHNGELHIDTGKGRGTTISITFRINK